MVSIADEGPAVDPRRAVAGPFPCSMCPRVCNRLDNLYKHQRRMHGVQPGLRYKPRFESGNWFCELCGKFFQGSQVLNRHQRKVHQLFNKDRRRKDITQKMMKKKLSSKRGRPRKDKAQSKDAKEEVKLETVTQIEGAE